MAQSDQTGTARTTSRTSFPLKGAAVVAAVAALILLGLWFLRRADFVMNDDRPPIIISNGPVTIRTDAGALRKNIWDWRHEHENRPPQVFEVTVAGGTCSGGNQPYRGRELTVTYADGTAQTIRIYIGKWWFDDYLKLDFNGVEPTPISELGLDVGAMAARITAVRIGPGNAQGPSCTFDGSMTPVITVAQRQN